MPEKKTFLQVFEEFESISSGKLDYYFEQAQNQVSESAFGVNYDHAVYLRLAHMLTLLGFGGTAAAGNITAEKAGDVQYSYSYVAGEEGLSSTQYGLQFIELRKENVVAALVL